MKLTVENGCFSYIKGQPVLQNMNFSAKSGELLAILGPNGAGKTTLLRCMMGFLPWESGRSTLDGEDMSKMSPKKLWQKIAYVPQAKGTSSGLLVSDMILLGCTNRMGVFATPGAKEKQQVENIASQLSISYLLNKKCNEISGGELQMVLIARALAAKPEILILDEPESNLDFKNQLIVLDTMSKLAAEGMCCIFNTHYPTHALMRATKSLIVQKNGNAFFGETPKIVTEKNIEHAFGVETVIGEVETSGNQYKSILPLRIAKEGKYKKEENTYVKNKNIKGSVSNNNIEGDISNNNISNNNMEGNSLDKCAENSSTENNNANQNRTRAIAVITVIFSEFALGDKINEIFHQHSEAMVGRMGMPYREGNVYIINVTLDAPHDEIDELFHRLSILPGVQAKVTFAELPSNTTMKGKEHGSE